MSSDTKQTLLDKLNSHIAVIGLGYVGLPLAVAFAEAGFPVVGIDVDQTKVDAINAGRSYISDIPSERLAAVTGNRVSSIGDRVVEANRHASSSRYQSPNLQSHLLATTDYAALAACDAAIICVPTPLNKTRDPDVRFLLSAGESVACYLHPGMLVVLESVTVHPPLQLQRWISV